MKELTTIILAAGRGTRLQADSAKVLVETDEGPLLSLVFSAISQLPLSRMAVVVGTRKEQVMEYVSEKLAQAFPQLPKARFCEQAHIDGTASAVRAALPVIEECKGDVLILCGDMPLIRGETLSQFLLHHHSSHCELSVLSGVLADPSRYGRIIRQSESDFISAIREWKDCSADERSIREVNAGVYLISASLLRECLQEVTNENQAGEYYLTDIVEIASSRGKNVSAFQAPDAQEMLGVNTRPQLHDVNAVLRERRISRLIDQGVRFVDPKTAYIDASVSFQGTARIGPSVIIEGASVIGDAVSIEGMSYLRDTIVEKEALVQFGTRATAASIGARCSVGPFCHLREATKLCEESKVGTFVETKKTTLHRGAKAPHLSYLGDTTVGEGANIGAGTITCNYDGKKKYPTEIGKGAFIGSNTSLVAPVKIEDGAYIGAGSTITNDVPEDSLSLSRAKQKTIPGWAKKRR